MASGVDGPYVVDVAHIFRPRHAAQTIPGGEHLGPMPLCWVAEAIQRGATVEQWEVSVDHEALPEFTVTTDRVLVEDPAFGCPDCRELIHA